MDNAVRPTTPSYNSPTIVARRKRILDIAQQMIAEAGYQRFNVLDLAKRAGVAERTVYNHFGTREGVVASAIHEYWAASNAEAAYRHSDDSLQGWLARQVSTTANAIATRAYSTAIMAVYNLLDIDPALRRAIRQLSLMPALQFTGHLASRGQLAKYVTSDALAQMLTTQIYATLSSWCADEIPHEMLIESMLETELIVLIGCTRGATRKEATEWLDHIRADDLAWRAFRGSVIGDKKVTLSQG